MDTNSTNNQIQNGDGSSSVQTGDMNVAPVSIWTAQKWDSVFSYNLQSSVMLVLVMIPVFVISDPSKVLHLSASCRFESDDKQLMYKRGFAALIFMLLPALCVFCMRRSVTGLTVFELAQQRMRLKIGYTICSLCTMVGFTFWGLTMMDFVEAIFGYWGCSSSSRALMVLICCLTVFLDLSLLSVIGHVIRTL